MRIVKEGFEEEYKILHEKKVNLERDKAEAYEKAKAEVDAKFSDREKTIEAMLVLISDEIPEEVQAEETTITVKEDEVADGMVVGVDEIPEGAIQVDGVVIEPSTVPVNEEIEKGPKVTF